MYYVMFLKLIVFLAGLVPVYFIMDCSNRLVYKCWFALLDVLPRIHCAILTDHLVTEYQQLVQYLHPLLSFNQAYYIVLFY